MADDIKRIDPWEFRELGFLQEANRLFFHPLGLALEIVTHEDGTVSFGGVWDYREDAEGIAFNDAPDEKKAHYVEVERRRHEAARIALFGQSVQPPGVGLPSADAGEAES